MFNPRDIIDLIAANVRRSRNPFGAPASRLNTWWRKARRRYQAAGGRPALHRADVPGHPLYRRHHPDSYAPGGQPLGGLSAVRPLPISPGSLAGWGLSFLTSGAEKQKFDGILRSICRLLTKSGVDFFYHPEMDFYSGILLYDLGDQEGFAAHARFVARTLKLHGVKKIITVDPHTTYALKELYPKYTGESFEVQPYFSLLQLASRSAAATASGR